jgi:hypothetical protein
MSLSIYGGETLARDFGIYQAKSPLDGGRGKILGNNNFYMAPSDELVKIEI